MLFSFLPGKQYLEALRAADVDVPAKPLGTLPATVLRGGSPIPEEIATDAEFQRAIDAWVAGWNERYFQHFGVAER